jgi:tRNA1(Val) A37 N6-methylase TrmN6
VNERQEAKTARVRRRWQPPPGPAPAGPFDDDLVPGAGETLDHLNGDWRIFQRLDGHRYSTDDLLTAWYACHVAADLALRVESHLDLGTGVGSVAMIGAWKLRPSWTVGIEAQALSASLMRRSLRYNGIADRALVRVGDLRDPALIPEGRIFDLVTGSPPYLAREQGVASERPQCAPCRFEWRGGAEAYAEAAARALAPRGVYVLVHEFRARERVRAASAVAGLRLTRVLPVIFCEGRPPHIAVYASRREPCAGEERAEEPLLIRRADGSRSDAYRSARAWLGFPP